MDLIQEIIRKAQSNKQRIVLPEGDEPRTLQAADRIIADGIADVILIGPAEKIAEMTAEFGLKNINKARIIDPKNNPEKQKYAEMLYEIRKSKGMTMEEAGKLAENFMYLGILLVKAGEADGLVSGARSTTGDMLRPALQIIKTVPGVTCVSGAFIMFLPNDKYGTDSKMVFADCAVTPVPTAEQLAEIAICTADTAKNIAKIDPAVAILSFSTKGSAKHEVVDKVIEATKIAQERRPDLQLDGELQADAAIVPSVGSSKAPNSKVAGKANTLVFPSLEVGNIAYKLVQRLAGAEAVGPVLQGLA
ncbi:MAG: phosphate acetyltransferase, partial [Bacteroidales bacterium]|nr:phosphate acetyltransferase [Bacteroidales bacterium]